MRHALDSTLECSFSQIQGIDNFLVPQRRPNGLQPGNVPSPGWVSVQRCMDACLGFRLVTRYLCQFRGRHGIPHKLTQIFRIVEHLPPVAIYVVLYPVDESLLSRLA